MSKPSKVLIAVPTMEFARRADFYDYYNGLIKPEGAIATFSHGQSPAKNRNLMIRMALEHDCTHIFFLDDDMCPPPDAVTRLLEHDKDIVSGLYLLRNYPHFPVMFEEWFPDGRCRYGFLEPNKGGLQRVVNCGFGCVLIKIEVFKALTDPWVTLGHYDKDNWCDDIHFFNKAREAGFEIYVDMECSVGHIMSAIIIPYRRPDDGQWVTLYNTNSVEFFQVPQLAPTTQQIDESLDKLGAKGQGKKAE